MGFYLAAYVARLTGADLFQVYAYLPLILNLLAVPAFCYLAAQILRTRLLLLGASILYVQLPESFIWQVTAGGMPRSLGTLFALLAVALALETAQNRSAIKLLFCGLLIGCAILSHQEWGLFAAVGAGLAFLSRSDGWARLGPTMAIGAVSLLVILLGCSPSTRGTDWIRSSPA
jgi:hypothetical protein